MTARRAASTALLLFAAAALAPSPALPGYPLTPFFGKEALPFSWVTGIFRDGEDVWVATKSGSRIYNLARKEWRGIPAGLDGSIVTGVSRFNGLLHVATEKAMNVEEGQGWRSHGRLRNAVAANGELVASGDRLWMAARTMIGGLLENDGKEWKLLSRGAGTGVMNNITRMAFWKGELWAGTVNNGIYLLKSGNWTVLGSEDGLPGNWVTSLSGGEGGMYAGTPEGLGYYNGEKWRIFRVSDGLPSNKISALKVYESRVVIGTFDRGIAVFDGKRFDTIGKAEGLSDDRVEFVEIVDGTAWVGTVNGLNLVRLT